VFSPAAAQSADTLIAVATNFSDAAEAIAEHFEARTGRHVTLASGSTGKLHAQITQGAPFAALLSADARTTARLEDEGRGVAGTRFTYAIGRLVVWSASAERIDGDGPAALRDAALRHVAIANPDLAPYGAAARTTLERLGLWETIRPKLVLGQNVGQAHSLVAAGAAELGLVARSQLAAADGRPGGSRWDVPAELHDPIVQQAILLDAGASDETARAFLEHLQSDESRATIRRFGYEVVE